MNFAKLTIASAFLAAPLLSAAAPLINEMQGCQGLLMFIDEKLEIVSDKYPAEDLQSIRVGLSGYDRYIQDEIVAPGLLQFNQGDKAKAAEMQVLVDEYKTTLVSRYHLRYPQPQLFTDHAFSVNDCAKQAVPAGQALEDLKVALNTMMKLAPAY